MAEDFKGQSPGLDADNSLPEVDNLNNFLEKHLKGQSKAVKVVCDSYEDELTLRLLEDNPGPLGVFLFLGPSGVGKTELARLLSEFFTGNKKSLIKIPCELFSQPHTIHTIIGSPHSYIGYGDPPMLSQKYIDKVIKPAKPVVPQKSKEVVALDSEIEGLLEDRRNYQKGIGHLLKEVDNNGKMIDFLEEYLKFLKNKEKDFGISLLELMSDAEKRKVITELLPLSVVKTMQSDLVDINHIYAMLIELYVEARLAVGARMQMEIGLKEIGRQIIAKSKELTDKNKVKVPIADRPHEKSKYFVVLFDEIEKGNKTLRDLLLEIAEDGRVTLANGQVTDLSRAFIVLTSNIAARPIAEQLNEHRFGFAGPSKKSQVEELDDSKLDELEKNIWRIAKSEMEKTFPPEFIGRLTDIVVFRPLRRDNLLEILELFIEDINKKFSMYLNIEIVIDSVAKDFIIKRSTDHPTIGARLLKNKFLVYIKRPIGRLINSYNKNKLPGQILVRVENDRLTFTPK